MPSNEWADDKDLSVIFKMWNIDCSTGDNRKSHVISCRRFLTKDVFSQSVWAPVTRRHGAEILKPWLAFPAKTSFSLITTVHTYLDYNYRSNFHVIKWSSYKYAKAIFSFCITRDCILIVQYSTFVKVCCDVVTIGKVEGMTLVLDPHDLFQKLATVYGIILSPMAGWNHFI